jgi:hypothetical protein
VIWPAVATAVRVSTIGSSADRVVEPHAFAQKDRRKMDHDLVEQPFPQALLGDIGAEDHDVPAAGRLHCHRDGVAKRTRYERDGFVRGLVPRPVGEHEDWAAPFAAVDPIDSVVQPLRDVIPPRIAPAERKTSSAIELRSTSMSRVLVPSSLHSRTAQSIESFGPAMKPLSDMVMCQIVLLMLGSLLDAARRTSPGPALRAHHASLVTPRRSGDRTTLRTVTYRRLGGALGVASVGGGSGVTSMRRYVRARRMRK